jgi:hypothetical protein
MPSFADPNRFIDLFQPDRCPICFTVQAYGHEHLKSLLDECVTDPSSRDRLFLAKGFCRRHAWQAVQQRQALGMGVIYASLLEKGLRVLSAQPRFWKSAKTKPCPICESEKSRESSCLGEFALCWTDSEKLRTAFTERGILCLPHLENILLQKMASSPRKSLHETGKKALGRLLQDLNEFLEKQDYHRSQESTGKEWDAWIRAVRMVSGERV